jgi:hypothetical protein
MCQIETRCQWRLATHRNICQGALRKLDRIGGRQYQCCPIFLENDQPNPIAALVGVRQQGKDSPFGGLHAFSYRHRPGSIHDEHDQIRRFLDSHLALQIAGLNGKSNFLALVFTVNLVGSGCPDRGIKSNIRGFAICRARLDVAAALALSLGARTTPGLPAG